MKRYSILFATVFITILLLESCKKNSVNLADQLPALTTEGENTFGCLIDDVPFIVDTIIAGNEEIYATTIWDSILHQYGSYISVFTNKKFGSDSGRAITLITIQSTEIKTGDVIQMGGDFPQYSDYQGEGYFNAGLGDDYRLYSSTYQNTPPSGEVKYTKFDIVNRIISGTFWYDAYNDDGEKVEMRDGRFDIKF